MMLKNIKEATPIDNSLVFCKSIHGMFYAARYAGGYFYPYAHTISDVPIGEVESWSYQELSARCH